MKGRLSLSTFLFSQETFAKKSFSFLNKGKKPLHIPYTYQILGQGKKYQVENYTIDLH